MTSEATIVLNGREVFQCQADYVWRLLEDGHDVEVVNGRVTVSAAISADLLEWLNTSPSDVEVMLIEFVSNQLRKELRSTAL